MYSNLKEGNKILFDNGLVKSTGEIEKVCVNPVFQGSKTKYIVKTTKGTTAWVAPSEILGLCE
jgi:hypothetical protein